MLCMTNYCLTVIFLIANLIVNAFNPDYQTIIAARNKFPKKTLKYKHTIFTEKNVNGIF